MSMLYTAWSGRAVSCADPTDRADVAGAISSSRSSAPAITRSGVSRNVVELTCGAQVVSGELLLAVSGVTQPRTLLTMSAVGPKLLYSCRCQGCQGCAQTLQQASRKSRSKLLACVWCHMASSVDTASASLGSRFLQASAQPSSAQYFN